MDGRKAGLLLFAAVCLSIVLAAVFSSGTGERKEMTASGKEAGFEPAVQSTDQPIQLKVTAAMSAKEFAALRQLTAEYESSHAGVTVSLENLNRQSAYSVLKKSAQLGEAADVMLLDNIWVSEFAALGYLLPIDSMQVNEIQSQQMEQALAQVKWNGYMWGLPKDIDVPVIAYSAKLLETLTSGKVPETSEELLDLHRRTYKPAERSFGIYADITDSQSFLTLARMLGGMKTVSQTEPISLKEQGLVQSLEAFLLGASGPASHSSPTGEGGTMLGFSSALGPDQAILPWELLAEGRLAGYLTTLSDWKENSTNQIILGRMPLPKGEEIGKGPWLYGRSFTISARSDIPEEAFAWIREMVSTSSAIRFWDMAGKLPAQKNSYVASMTRDEALEKSAIWIDQQQAGPSRPQLMGQLKVMSIQLEKLRKGEQSVKEFAERTTEEWEKSVKKAP